MNSSGTHLDPKLCTPLFISRMQVTTESVRTPAQAKARQLACWWALSQALAQARAWAITHPAPIITTITTTIIPHSTWTEMALPAAFTTSLTWSSRATIPPPPPLHPTPLPLPALPAPCPPRAPWKNLASSQRYVQPQSSHHVRGVTCVIVKRTRAVTIGVHVYLRPGFRVPSAGHRRFWRPFVLSFWHKAALFHRKRCKI